MAFEPHSPAEAPVSASGLAHWRARWAALRHWPWLATLRTLRQRFREDRLGVTAGSLTFTTTIALVPLATVMFAVFTAFPMFAQFRASVEHYLVENLVPDTIARPVMKQLTLFADKAHQVGALGVLLLGVTAIALLLTIDRTLNGLWRVRQPRGIARRVLIYWAIATLGPLVLGVSLSLTSYLLSVSRGWASALPGGVSLLLGSMELAMLVLGMAALYKFVPNTQVKWAHALSGGLFVALGFELAKRLLAWYVSVTPVYKTIYGAFSAVPLLLLWIYLGWVIVLFGAVIAAYAPSLEMRVIRPDSVGWPFRLALQVLRELHAARRQTAVGRHGVALQDLAARLRVDPLQIEPVLDHLVALDWAGRLDEPGAARYVLLVEPGVTPAAPLVQTWLIERGADTAPFWGRADFDRWVLADLLPEDGVSRAIAG